MKLQHTSKTQELIKKVDDFMREYIYPAEEIYEKEMKAFRNAGNPWRIPGVLSRLKKQAKEFNTIINKKGFKSGIYNTDLKDDERQENLEDFKKGKLNVLVSCTALDEGFDMPEADGAMILSASSSKRQRIQRMGRVLRITANKENALIVTVYSSKTEYEKLREESNRYQLEGVPVKWQQMSL